ncbi:DeoR faimly transcriptional regulator [Sphingobacterium sp. ML3W]|uniref:DeoR/GlpR family DNA-binding transcription regulator n=1 Tax=Sphingobacterium sp. ML3W TaxID=1538644 RepID=UPI0004F8483C|nr:DeoR/GlpR family DNA-binding transcription regulator [Sphingobacterium sp. ML3W]AIM37233.1 DeoR faimly transcriptional regulator [Sphingobacterium sp. ML3W]
MLKEKRFEFILDQLKSEEMVSYEILAKKLNVSEDTMRRDIDHLHKIGLLSKVRGGAIQRVKNPLTFEDRNSYLKKEKDIIALKAQQFIKEGMTVFMDGGTTICAIVNYLPTEINLRIVTSNVMLIPILDHYPNIELILLGGKYHKQTASTMGQTTSNEARNYIADLYFMGTCGVDWKFGISAFVKEDAEVKLAMLTSAKKVVALANQDRLGVTESFKVCDVEQVDVLITNLPTAEKSLDEFRQQPIILV